MTKNENGKRGISMRSINLIMSAIILILSMLLLLTTYRANAGYDRMRESTAQYVEWRRYASDLQEASDFLTEQVRCFVETGNRDYLDRYFEEAEVTRRRDTAVEMIHSYMGESEAYNTLLAALAESVELMEREYYAMRLTVAAYGYDAADYPEAVRQVELTAEDAALSAEKQDALARSMVFDDVYRGRKEAISQNARTCLTELAGEIDRRQEQTADHLNDILSWQQLLIFLSITITIFILLAMLLLVISPLLHAVSFIRSNKPLPIKGSKEFQFLAKTYNLMYEANRVQKEHLAYEATHDNLTGIYNRNGYNFIRDNTDWNSCALLLFDLDKFKLVNDTYGHKMGDEVLIKTAACIKTAFRAQDYVCRIGGDEFAVIMVNLDASSADVIRRKVETINDSLGNAHDGIPPITISCGAAYGEWIGDYDKLFKEADAALYRVKGSGGRGCEVCENPGAHK